MCGVRIVVQSGANETYIEKGNTVQRSYIYSIMAGE